MSSAERCRVELFSRISRIFRRGSVTFRPALRRSLPSTIFSGNPGAGYDDPAVLPKQDLKREHATNFDGRQRLYETTGIPLGAGDSAGTGSTGPAVLGLRLQD